MAAFSLQSMGDSAPNFCISATDIAAFEERVPFIEVLPKQMPNDILTTNPHRKATKWLRRSGECFRRLEKLSTLFAAGFRLLLADLLLLCFMLLIAKAIGKEFWRDWWPDIPLLGNWTLQAANLLLVLSYSMNEFLYLRICLSLACVNFMLYAMTSPIGMMLDMFFFNLVMFLLNVRHAISLLSAERYIEFPPAFEQVYTEVFSEFLLRTDFQFFVDAGLLRTEQAGVILKQQGDLVTSLCLLVEGHVGVRKNGRYVNEYHANDLMDAPEWVRSNLNPDNCRIPVSCVTQSKCVFIKWPRETLVALLHDHPQCIPSLRAVLGIQVSQLWLRSMEIKDHETSARACSPFVGSRFASHDSFQSTTELERGMLADAQQRRKGITLKRTNSNPAFYKGSV